MIDFSTIRMASATLGKAAANGAEPSTMRAAMNLPEGGHSTISELRALSNDSTIPGWNIGPKSLAALREAENRGVSVLNSADAIEHTNRKGNLAAVLDAAGIPHAADGTMVRTRGELESAITSLGGEARVTGGFSHARVGDYAKNGGSATLIRNSADLDAFATNRVDHSRAFLVQGMPKGEQIHVATAGRQVLDAGGATLAPAEQEMAANAARAFGINAGGVDLVRGADGTLRVIDVHATPQIGKAAREELLRTPQFAQAIAEAGPASTQIADGIESAKPAIGVLNMGNLPGKNISRTLAEVERQGGHPVFLPTGATKVGADGAVSVNGVPVKVDSAITRTGSIASDEAIGVLKDLEKANVPLLNNAEPMLLVRDKNIQAKTLIDNGVAHPQTTTVETGKDVDGAIKLLGDTMVLKNPASSEGRGVMFLQGEDLVRGVTNLFENRANDSRLVATRVGDTSGANSIELVDRASTERAIRELGNAKPVQDAATGQKLLEMQNPVKFTDVVTGNSVNVDKPVSALSISDAFRDAKPGASLKAETWYKEAAGVDTRVHVAKRNGEYQVLAAMERRAAPNEFGEARSNLSLGGGATAITPDAAQRETAIKAAKAFGLDIAGVDLIATKKGPVALEVNSSPGLDIEHTVGSVAEHWVDEALNLARK